MKVLVQGKEYKLWFKHNQLNGLKYRGITTCYIFEDASNGFFDHAFSSGQSLCMAEDNFEKAVGRKLALARAVMKFSREDRKVIWDQYFAAIRGGK